MSDKRTAALEYLHANQERFLRELKAFCALPSVSTDANARPAIQQAADWVADHLRSLGVPRVDVMPTAGYPVVYGELMAAGSQAPTVLVYGHYDVQPAEPLELWESGAFDATVRGDYIYARGVTDMKGQVLAAANAIEAILSTGPLPVNVKFMIEGEEEIGSPSLASFMREHQQLLACDMALNPDSGILSAELPSITYALRGLAYFEIRVYGPDHDLHSGVFGGTVHNPAQALCELIAGMHDAEGKITLPGFYDRVLPLDEEERREMARLPMDAAYYKRETGAPELWGEPGYTPQERASARPTLEVHGLLSGFTGEGGKTVLPAWAMAKISCRLVPDQDPAEVHQALLKYLEQHAPASIRYEVIQMSGGSPASLSNRNSSGVQALRRAMEQVWGVRPVFKREGGSVPVVLLFKQILHADSVNTGFAMAGDNLHSPNEKLHLPTWRKGTQALVHFFYNLVEA